MGTVSDNCGIKRFGKPHLTHRGPLSVAILTVRGDRVGRARNSEAIRFAVERNDAYYDRAETPNAR